jgi:hypothetical protein
MVEANEKKGTLPQKKLIAETGISMSQQQKESVILHTATTLSRGELPSNVEINQTLEKAKETISSREENLDEHGKKLAKDTEQLIESTQSLLEHKNKDESLQKIVKDVNLLEKEASERGEQFQYGMQKELKDSSEEISKLTKGIIENTRDFVWYLVKSNDFKAFLFELIDLLQTVLREADARYGDAMNRSLKSDIEKEQADLQETSKTVSEIKTNLKERGLLSEQEKRSIEDRFENLFLLLSQYPQYDRALDNIYKLIYQLYARMERLRINAKIEMQQIDSNDRSREILDESYNLMIQFVNEEDLTKFSNFFWDLFNDLKNDMEARQFFYDFRQYLFKQIETPEKITDEYRKQEAKQFRERATNLFRLEQSKYGPRFNELFQRAYDLLIQIKKDEDTQRLTSSINQLAQDFFLDEKGRPDLFVIQDSIIQIKNLVLPIIIKQFENISLPVVEGSTSKYDYRIDNMILNVTDIIPDQFNLKFISNIELGQAYKSHRAVSKLKLKAGNIRFVLNDIHFWYSRNVMPKLTDEGIADVKILGGGLNLKIVWKLSMSSNHALTIELSSIKCYIDKLDISIKNCHHSIINKLAIKLFGGNIKRKIAQTIVENIRDTLEPLNEQLNALLRKEKEMNLLEKANLKLKEAYETKQESKPVTEKICEKAQDLKEVMVQKKELKEGLDKPKETISSGFVETTTTPEQLKHTTEDYANLAKGMIEQKPAYIDEASQNDERYHGAWKKEAVLLDTKNPFRTGDAESDITGPPNTL